MRTRARAARQSRTTLTERERDVIRLVAGGWRNREIAKRLRISEGTVKIHLHNIYKKLRVESRLMLGPYAHDKGIEVIVFSPTLKSAIMAADRNGAR